MKMKKRSSPFFAVLAFALGTMLFAPAVSSAADAELVLIQPVGDDALVGLYVDPPVLRIDKGTIVIWLSGVPDDQVQVIFEDGKACKDVTLNPKGFHFDSKDCYVTNFINYSETSSLEFPQAGKFAYTVETQDGKIKSKGRLIVR